MHHLMNNTHRTTDQGYQNYLPPIQSILAQHSDMVRLINEKLEMSVLKLFICDRSSIVLIKVGTLKSAKKF